MRVTDVDFRHEGVQSGLARTLGFLGRPMGRGEAEPMSIGPVGRALGGMCMLL